MVGINFDPGFFKTIDVNPGMALKLFEKYVNQMPLVQVLAFRKADETSYTPSDQEKKAMLLLGYVDDIKDFFQNVGRVTDTDAFMLKQFIRSMMKYQPQ